LAVLGGIGSRDAEERSPAEVQPAHLVDGEGQRVGGVALHDPLEAVADAHDLDTFEDRSDGGRADDAVDTGRRAAAYEDSKLAHAQKHAPRRSICHDSAARAARRPSSRSAPTRASALPTAHFDVPSPTMGGWPR